MLTWSSQEAGAVVLVFQQGGPVDQPLGRVPDHVTHSIFGINPEQVLEDAQERDLLRGVDDLLQDGVEHVQVGAEVNPVGPFNVGLVGLLLLVKDINLNDKIAVGLLAPQDVENVEDFQPDELVPDPVSILQYTEKRKWRF